MSDPKPSTPLMGAWSANADAKKAQAETPAKPAEKPAAKKGS